MNISSSYYSDRHPDCMWAKNIRQRYAFPKVESKFYCPCCVEHPYKNIPEIATHLVTIHTQTDIETMGYSVFMLHRVIHFDKVQSASVATLEHYISDKNYYKKVRARHGSKASLYASVSEK